VAVTGLNREYLEITMTLLLVAVAAYTILGGMLSVLVTDYLQFLVMSLGLVVTTLFILAHQDIGWAKLVATVEEHHGAGGFNPFVNKALGWPFVLFNALLNLSAVLTWQTVTQRILAAKDSRTGQKVLTHTSFFFVCRFLIPGLWGIAALAIVPAIGQDASLMAMPHLLATILPIGILGILVAAMLAADMSTDSSYMLTWGSVIYNDILAPFRKGWSEKKGLLINRMIVACIGVFLLIYGLWYPMKQDLWTYLGVTGTIYLSSMSVLLIACCYWKRANSWGAIGAITVGATIPIVFLVLERVEATSSWADRIGPYYSGAATYVLVAVAMVVGSWLKPRQAERAAA
jgi:SSS family solute:Na+ symporter